MHMTMKTRSSLVSASMRRACVPATVFALAILPGGCGRDSTPPVRHGDEHGHADAGAHPELHAGSDAHADAHADEVTLTADAVAASGISVSQAQSTALQPTIFAPARVALNADATAHVGSPLHGRIAEMRVRVGDTVKPGDELIVLESAELGEAQAEYLQKRNASQAAVPAVELARVAWERGRALYEKSKGITLTEVQRREAEHKAAIAAQRAAETAALASAARLRILGMTAEQVASLASGGAVDPRHAIRAPIGGTVVQREASLGELVGPDRDALLVLADTATLWVLADLPETRVADVMRGSKAWVSLGTAAPIDGTVAFIAPLVDPATRTVQVRIDVATAPGGGTTLRPGMFAQAEIATAVAGGAAAQVAVPEDAVQQVAGGPAVFVPVKGEPNTFAKRPVTVGRPVGGMVPVLSGLAPGEEFVSRGSFVLKAELGKGSAAHEH